MPGAGKRAENHCNQFSPVRVHLDPENKTTILQALIDVIKSDAEINVLEIDVFNQVIKALRMSPAEQQGLTT